MSLPTRDAILAFVRESDGNVGKREIARVFGLHGPDRDELRALLRDMQDEGVLELGSGRTLHEGGGLPKVTVLQVVEAAGDRVIAIPARWDHASPPPRVRVIERGRKGALGVGDRILARIEQTGQGHTAHPMKKLRAGHVELLGTAERAGPSWRLKPVDKRARHDHELDVADLHPEPQPGELLLCELRGSGARARAHVLERLGDPFAPKSLSLIAIHAKNIPHVFDTQALAEADSAATKPLGPREDLRDLPLITIDPADARDHDDAVHATADGDGWRLRVAIADVSWFVAPGTALDRAAFERGNSVYFPDRVVPMLPHALSSGACSLVEGEDRAALVADMRVNADGTLGKSTIRRALIRIHAGLAYEEAQARIDGTAAAPPGASDGTAAAPPGASDGTDDDALTRDILRPLWACWRALSKARTAREPLELDLPEKQVILDPQGNIAQVRIRERLDAHRVIEDMMIAANVAAAKALEAKKAPVMYRDHEPPSREKLVALKDYLETVGLKLALGQVVRPALFNRFLALTKERDDAELIAEQVLRSQTQAYYAPANTGHFGLSLGSYAHFTSPIRRYADLVVHRALVRAYNLGEGGLTDGEAARMPAIGDHVSVTERRAMEAERETLDRYVAAHLASHVGKVVAAKITGVAAFGFFATVEGVGGDGLVPMGALGDEWFHFDEAARALIGRDGTTFRVGQRLELLLAESDPATGALRFALPGVAPREAVGRKPGGRRRDGGKTAPTTIKRGGPPKGVKRGRRG